MLLLKCHDLLDTARMASSAELSGKERPQNLLVSGQVDETTRKSDDVCVIVLAAQRSEGGGYDICRADSVNLVCGDSDSI